MIKVGNVFYFLEIIVLATIFIALYFILKNKNKKTQYKFLLIWCFVNFSVHFLKQLVYLDVNSFYKSSFENICAVSTLVFPFIMLIKKDSIFKDFMYLIGVLGGFIAIFYPTEAINRNFYEFESIRFYFCHFSLFAIPLYLAIFNIYRPRINKFYLIPLVFLLYELLICLNTGVLVFTGALQREGFSKAELFFNAQYYNNSFTFGPTPDMGFFSDFMSALCPSFMKIDVFNLNGGNVTYWPVIWLLIPSYVLFVPLYLLLCLPFYKKKNKSVN